MQRESLGWSSASLPLIEALGLESGKINRRSQLMKDLKNCLMGEGGNEQSLVASGIHAAIQKRPRTAKPNVNQAQSSGQSSPSTMAHQERVRPRGRPELETLAVSH